MLSKIKKYFFSGIFVILYISFVAQLVYILSLFFRDAASETVFIALGFMSLQWLIIIAARYLSKKSANSANRDGGNQYFNNNNRRR